MRFIEPLLKGDDNLDKMLEHQSVNGCFRN